ncbi:MAG: polysaccharide deacetylase family protein [Thermoleophilia bacterium]|nr:polysaccharide deacetylase family protein [Thermoleophilia bacterium]
MLRTVLHLAAAPVALGRATAVARVRRFGTLTSVRTDEPVVALTFDDGPHPEYTPRLLDILRRHRARATFFVVGERVARAREVARRIVDEGHVLANHTWSHARMTEMTSPQRREEIRRCAEAIAPLGGLPMFRPPQGRQSVGSRMDIHRGRHDCIAWSAYIEDWLPQSPEMLTARLRAAISPGAIVVLHDAICDPTEDGAEDREALLAAVDAVLAERSGDMRFVTVPELRALGSERRKAWITA